MAEKTKQTVAELENKIAALEKENADIQEGFRNGGVPPHLKEDVRWRMAAGLEKHQALQAAQAQYDWDKEQATTAKAAAPQAL